MAAATCASRSVLPEKGQPRSKEEGFFFRFNSAAWQFEDTRRQSTDTTPARRRRPKSRPHWRPHERCRRATSHVALCPRSPFYLVSLLAAGQTSNG